MGLVWMTKETTQKAAQELNLPPRIKNLDEFFQARFRDKRWPAVKQGKYWLFDVEKIKAKLEEV